MLHIILGIVQAQAFNPYEGSMMVCEGIWGQKEIPFAREKSSIQVKFKPLSDSGSATLAVFRFEDQRFVVGDAVRPTAEVCDFTRMDGGLCSADQLGKFMLKNNTEDVWMGPLLNEAVHWHSDFVPPVDHDHDHAVETFIGFDKRQLNESTPTTSSSSPAATATELPSSIHDLPRSDLSFQYHVHENGLYCVLIIDDDTDVGQDYEVDILVANPYGRLPAIFFPALPFFATSFAVYTTIGLIWLVVSILNRKELLPIQNLIGGLIFFLMVENAVNMAFFIDFNNHGYVSKGFLAAMVTLNAARNSFSFFMVLVVSLGYGVVYPTLGKKMWACILLAIIHFIFGAMYFTTSMLSKDMNSFFVFLIGLPLSLSLMGFYIWILVGITETIQFLESKRQSVKLEMYQRLSWILTCSIVLLAIIFVANSVNIAFRHNPTWVANQWKWRWLLLDGALNTNYFLAFVAIAYIWMPTTNNARLGLMQLDSEDLEDPRDFVELESPNDDEHVLEWAERHAKESGVAPYATDKLMDEEMEELN
jgi:hypothetical protein